MLSIFRRNAFIEHKYISNIYGGKYKKIYLLEPFGNDSEERKISESGFLKSDLSSRILKLLRFFLVNSAQKRLISTMISSTSGIGL